MNISRLKDTVVAISDDHCIDKMFHCNLSDKILRYRLACRRRGRHSRGRRWRGAGRGSWPWRTSCGSRDGGTGVSAGNRPAGSRARSARLRLS